jgi:hypothetical protein
VPIDATTHGRLRARGPFTTGGPSADATELALRGSENGWRRAFQHLVLEGVRLTGNCPLAVWSILRPGDNLTVDSDDPPETQNFITVNYFLAGRFPAGTATPKVSGPSKSGPCIRPVDPASERG